MCLETTSIGRRRLLHDAGELPREVALIGESACVADFGKVHGGLYNFVTGILDFEVTHVVFRGHAETGFEFPLEGAEREVGGGG